MNPVISLLNNHDVEIRQKTLPGSIPRSDIANLLDAIARTIEKDVDYALGIPFDSMVSAMSGKQLTANDKYFVSQVGSIPGSGCILTLKGDGSHSPDLTNFLVVSGSYSNTVNVVNQLIFYYDGANYCVAIIQLPAGAVLNTTAGSSGPDTTPPVVVSIAVLNANPSQVVITYSEGLKTTAIPAASDFVITAGGSPATINSVAVSANTVLLNLASAIIAGSSNFIQYTPGTNKIQDLAGNLAAAIPVNTLITNNVGTGGGTGATQLNAPVLTAGTPTGTTVPLTWTDTNTSPNESSLEIQQSADAGTTWVAASPNTAAANATSSTAGGLTGNTAYQFRVRAVGDGTTTTTSAWSNIVSATTANNQPFTENFNGVTPPALPATMTFTSGYQTVASGAVDGTNALQSTNTSATQTGWRNVVEPFANRTVEMSVYISSGAFADWGLLSRFTTAALTGSGYEADWEAYGSSVGVRLYRVVTGTATQIASGAFPANVATGAYRILLTTTNNGANIDLTVQFVRVSDGFYLNGTTQTWQAGAANALTFSDTTPPAGTTSAGYAGFYSQGASGTSEIDNFKTY